MSAPTLEPYATRQRWQSAAPLLGEAWQALLVAYLAGLARACDAAGPCVIGHIKALALFDTGDYLRLSAISAAFPPTVDGRVPDGLAALSLSLNVLVYGLPAAALHDLTWRTAAALAQDHALTLAEDLPSPPEDHAHGNMRDHRA